MAAYKFKLTLANAKVPAVQTNYPALIDSRISSIPNDFWTNISDAGGLDIRIWNAVEDTEYSHREVVFINAGTKKLELYFNVPSLPAATDLIIWVYCGGDNLANSTGTWNDKYEMVQHFQNNLLDSTVNGHNGTLQGAAGYNATGPLVGSCLELSGDAADFANGFGVMPAKTSVTVAISAYVYQDTNSPSGAVPAVVINDSTAGPDGEAQYLFGPHSYQNSWLATLYDDVGQIADRIGKLQSNASLTVYKLMQGYVCASIHSTLWQDGVAVGANHALGNQATSVHLVGENITIGRVADGATGFDGKIDEVRIIIDLDGIFDPNWAVTDANIMSDPDSCWIGSDGQLINGDDDEEEAVVSSGGGQRMGQDALQSYLNS